MQDEALVGAREELRLLRCQSSDGPRNSRSQGEVAGRLRTQGEGELPGNSWTQGEEELCAELHREEFVKEKLQGTRRAYSTP